MCRIGSRNASPIVAPARDIPRAILTASIVVTLVYVAGTLMLVVTIPEGEVGIIEGVAQSFRQVELGLGLAGIGAIGALLVAASTVGLFASWMTGTARIPFVIGLTHYLPDVVAKVHPRWGSPWVSLLLQGITLSVLYVAAIAGATLREAFLVLLDMSIILYFIPFLYLFAAFIRLARRSDGGQGIFPVFGRSPLAVWVVGGAGFAVTLLSTVLSAVPSQDVENGRLFVLKVVGGSIVLIGAGLLVYARKRVDRSFE